MDQYDLTWRRHRGNGKFTRWATFKGLTGHRVDPAPHGETMVLFRKNGGQQTIADWHQCEIKLGADWVLATRAAMEREAGQDVKLKPGVGEADNGSV